MATDLTVILEDKPGTLADLGEALGAAGVNIDGFCGFPCEGRGVIHILVGDGPAARAALTRVGMQVEAEREVLLVEAEDRPGALGEVARKIARAGVNINLVYKVTQTQIAIGADDPAKAKSVL